MELYPTSSHYGAASILKQYAKIAQSIATPARLQHGWYFKAYPVGVSDLESIGVWCWSRRIALELNQINPEKPVYAIGATFLYLLQLQGIRPYCDVVPRQEGTIVFPCHSSVNIRAKCDYEEYAEMLASLGKEYWPISVCVYETDLPTGYADIFRRRGFDVVTNGRRSNDPSFLNRFIENTAGKRYALSNQMTSALLYASALGTTSFLYGPKFQIDASDDPNLDGVNLTKYHDNWVREHGQHFAFESSSLQDQREHTSSELGLDDVKTPKALRSLFLRCAATVPYLATASSAYARHVSRRFKNLLSHVRS